MRKFKTAIIFILIFTLVSSLFACGEYREAVNGDVDLPTGSVPQPELDDDPTNDFTVRLRLNEEAYIPTTALNVYWNDGYNIHLAPVDSTGTATIDGLDGDYRVTLSAAPSGYAYDPNAYIATNDNRHIIIDMYDLNLVTGGGTGLYECYEFTGTGIYSVTINANPDTSVVDQVFFQFAPTINGTYTVESWVNTADDEVNPICTAYLGSSSFKYGAYTVTETGVCGSFTRNFIHTINIADQNISTGGGGSQTYTFSVSAETKSGVYPVTYTFAVKRNGGFDLNLAEKSIMEPKFDWSGFDFEAFEALAGGEIIGAETVYPGTVDSMIFDEDNYKLWEKSAGGDGFYHVFDEEKYPETGGYGPMLVAYITSPCEYLDRPFTEIESVGNNALTVNGTENYKQFIEGFDAVASAGYYCVSNCPCHPDAAPDTPIACLPGCDKCHSNCDPCPENMMGKDGYAQKTNSDGVCPVTPELKEFLQKFAISSRYFADGDGWAERTGVDSYEDSQWLFACGYYK